MKGKIQLRASSRGVFGFRTLVLLLMLCAILLTVVAPRPADADDAEVIDVIILLDKTGSMVGKGHSVGNIWDEVLDYVSALIDVLGEGCNFALVPFDQGIVRHQAYPQANDAILTVELSDHYRNEAKEHLLALIPDGGYTEICRSLDAALSQMKAWQDQDPTHIHRQRLYLYTDGKDTGDCADVPVQGIIDRYRLHHSDLPHLYFFYADLRHVLTPEERDALEGAGIDVTVGIPKRHAELLTTELDFGDISSGGKVSGSIEFSNRSDASAWGAQVRVYLRMKDELAISLDSDIILLRESIPINLEAVDGVPPGIWQGELVLEPLDDDLVIEPKSFVGISFTWPAPTPTNTSTHTPTSTPTYTPTSTPTHTPTSTPTNTPTYTPTSTPTYTPTSTPTYTPTNTRTHTPTYTPTHMPTNTPTKTPTITPTATPTHTPIPALQFPQDTIDFGDLDDLVAGKSISFTIESSSPNSESLMIRDVRFQELPALEVVVVPAILKPLGETEVTISISADERLGPGTYAGTFMFKSREGVLLRPAAEIPFKFHIRSVWERYWVLLLGLATLLLVGFGGYLAYLGSLPKVSGTLKASTFPAGTKKRDYHLAACRKKSRRNEVIVGSSRGSGIRLAHSTIKPSHARISAERRNDVQFVNGKKLRTKTLRYYIKNLGKGVLTVDANPVEEGHRARLIDRSEVKIGDYHFEFRNAAARRQ